MTRFRYDAVIFVDSHEQVFVEPRWMDWTGDGLTLDAIREFLQSGGEMLAIKGVVNATVEKDVETLARLAKSNDSTMGDLKEVLNNTRGRGVRPGRLESIAKEFGYLAETSWAACRSDGSFDVFFRRLGERPTGAAIAWPLPATIAEDLTLHVHDPSRMARRQLLIRQLRDHVKATLPESIVPAEFVLVNALPLTSAA
jgi:hypothetical protein